MPLSPGTRLGHYDVTALIGEGGMGQVGRRLTPSSTARSLHPVAPTPDQPALAGVSENLLFDSGSQDR